MSVEALTYAKKVRVGDITAKYVLFCLADRADERFSCFPSVPLLAAEAERSERVVQRALAKLRTLRLISDRPTERADGSQGSNRYYLHGPWDSYGGTGVPFPEITTPREARASLWAQAPVEGAFREGTAAAAVVADDQEALDAALRAAAEAEAAAAAAAETRREKGRRAAEARPKPQAGDISAGQHGVTSTSPPPVTSTSPPPVTSTSPPPVTSTSPLEPSVATTTGTTSDERGDGDRPSVCDGGDARAADDGRTDGQGGGANGDQEQRQVVRTPGVELLLRLGATETDPRFAAALTGGVLADQGRMVTGMLAEGWTQAQVRAVITGRPLPPPEEITRSVGAVIARRLRDAAAAGPPMAAPAAAATPVPPAFGDHLGSAWAECGGGAAGDCRAPVMPGYDQCWECLGMPVCGCGHRRFDPALGGRCDTCEADDVFGAAFAGVPDADDPRVPAEDAFVAGGPLPPRAAVPTQAGPAAGIEDADAGADQEPGRCPGHGGVPCGRPADRAADHGLCGQCSVAARPRTVQPGRRRRTTTRTTTRTTGTGGAHRG
ncbi:helix-turn-helix domain-containing protein [Streptomyces sp. NPDC049879]|uniref:helix-turn-helix domain-containing protein n=1 Tax=Streptomyces sp. NPDC049879 TaxID=3365598 RepID=UPI003797A2AF